MARCDCVYEAPSVVVPCGGRPRKTIVCDMCLSYGKKVAAHEALGLARFELDVLDDQIVELLLARFRRLEKVAAIKVDHELVPHDPGRERAIEERMVRRTEHAPPEVRLAVEDLMREVVRRGRLQVDLRMRLIREDRRHDQGDGKADLDGSSGRGPARGPSKK